MKDDIRYRERRLRVWEAIIILYIIRVVLLGGLLGA